MATRRGHRVTRSRRETSWLGIDIVSQSLNGAAAITHVMTAAELAKRPFTVVRTHLSVRIESDQSAASEKQMGGIGLCVVSSQAVAVGVTAVPTPLTELESDLWFVHQIMQDSFLFGDATGFTDPTGTIYNIDSKAMRRVNDDQEIVIVGEGAGGAFGGLIMDIAGRLLIKEH